jgi:hypothetical protein
MISFLIGCKVRDRSKSFQPLFRDVICALDISPDILLSDSIFVEPIVVILVFIPQEWPVSATNQTL